MNDLLNKNMNAESKADSDAEKRVVAQFEKKVMEGLKKCGINLNAPSEKTPALAAAVSGGADSTALLVALSSILSSRHIPLYVISVNHFIRADEETCGDVEFVKNTCESLRALGGDIRFFEYALAKGEVETYCRVNKTGVEDAARALRYQAFEDFLQKNNLDALCLAHNQNDQLETSLMRIFKGDSLEDLSFIPRVRHKFLRPLLDLSREEIENYLKAKNQSWRTDSTNSDINYLRNKIRHKLIPLLNQDFTGWQKGILNGIEKTQKQREYIKELTDRIPLCYNEEEKSVSIDRAAFVNAAAGPNDFLQIELLYKAFSLLNKNRIPYSFMLDLVKAVESSEEAQNNKIITKNYEDLEIILKKEQLLIKKSKNNNTDLIFFDIIEEIGTYEFPFGILEVQKGNGNLYSFIINGCKVEKAFSLPLCVRNLQTGDKILTAQKDYKKVIDIFKDWQIPEEMRRKIPLVQSIIENQELLCILGKSLGFKDWIVN